MRHLLVMPPNFQPAAKHLFFISSRMLFQLFGIIKKEAELFLQKYGCFCCKTRMFSTQNIRVLCNKHPCFFKSLGWCKAFVLEYLAVSAYFALS